MDKIPFENGTLVTPAKVTIDNVEYEVTPAVYTGEIPLSAENLIQMQDNIETAIKEILKIVFPVGSTYITQTDINPSTILDFGTWERLKGRVCVGLDEDDEDFDSIGKIGGAKTHTLTTNQLPEFSLPIGLARWRNTNKIWSKLFIKR